ncbi:hypothetical protein RX830_27625, partial [Pseudomonas syringae pv. actinidiae]
LPYGWPDSRGMGGRIIVESVAGCSWDGWPDDRGIRSVTGVSGVAVMLKYMKNKDKIVVTLRRKFLCM